MNFADDGIFYYYVDALVTKVQMEGMSFQCFYMFIPEAKNPNAIQLYWINIKYIVHIDCSLHIVLQGLLKHNNIMCILTEVDIHMKSKHHI